MDNNDYECVELSCVCELSVLNVFVAIVAMLGNSVFY